MNLDFSNLSYAVNELVDGWLDTLSPNYKDFVVIDNEESDFGVIVYTGVDNEGNADVHLATAYVKGGDTGTTALTDAGIVIVEKIIKENYERLLKTELENIRDPGSMYNLRIGMVADYEADCIQFSERAIEVELPHTDNLPIEIKDGDVLKMYGDFYVADVNDAGVRFLSKRMRKYLAGYEVEIGRTEYTPRLPWGEWLKKIKHYSLVTKDCPNEDYPQ